jgi:hypothetical protein
VGESKLPKKSKVDAIADFMSRKAVSALKRYVRGIPESRNIEAFQNLLDAVQDAHPEVFSEYCRDCVLSDDLQELGVPLSRVEGVQSICGKTIVRIGGRYA